MSSKNQSAEGLMEKEDQSCDKEGAWIDQRMTEMKIKNAQVMKRYELVEKDRMDAERQQAAVTAGCSRVILQPPKREKPFRHAEKRFEREWDVGKSSDGDWSDEHRNTRPPKRGGYSDRRRDKTDSNWRNQENADRIEPRRHDKKESNWRNHENPDRRSSNFCGTARNPDSNHRNLSHNFNSYHRSYGHGYKNNESYNKGNWNNSKNQQFCNFPPNLPFSNFQTPSAKLSIKDDNDKVWRNEEHNEAQHKQSRVEKWVKSISEEDWGNCDHRSVDDDCVDHIEDKPKLDWCDDVAEESNGKKKSHYQHKTAKYDKKYEKSTHRNASFNDGRNFEKVRKSSISDLSRKEDSRPNFKDKNQQRFRKDYMSQNRRADHSYSVRESDQQSSQFNKFSSNNHTSENKNLQKHKVSSGTWSDNEGGIIASKTACAGTGGTWSDQEDVLTDNVGTGWEENVEKNESRSWGDKRNKNQISSNSTSWNNKYIRKPFKRFDQYTIDDKDTKRASNQKCDRHEFEISSKKTFNAKDVENIPTDSPKEDITVRLKKLASGRKISSKETSSNPKNVENSPPRSPKEDINTRLLKLAYGPNWGEPTNEDKSSSSECEIIFEGKPLSTSMEQKDSEIQINEKINSDKIISGDQAIAMEQKSSDLDCEIIFVGEPLSSSTPKQANSNKNQSLDADINEKYYSEEITDELVIPMEVGFEEKDLLDEDFTINTKVDESIEKMRDELSRSECDSVLNMSRDINVCDKFEIDLSQCELKDETLISTSDISRLNSFMTDHDVTINASPTFDEMPITDKSDFEQNDLKVYNLETLSSVILQISMKNDDHRKIQPIKSDKVDKSCIKMLGGISNSPDFLHESSECNQSAKETTEINNSIDNAQIGVEKKFSYQVEKVSSENAASPKCLEKEASLLNENLKPTQSAIESENNSGALTDNDWSTIDDESEADVLEDAVKSS